MKWKELAVSRMLLVMIQRRANTSFLIVQRKVLTDEEVFVTTVKGWSQGKNINRKTTLLTWLLPLFWFTVNWRINERELVTDWGLGSGLAV